MGIRQRQWNWYSHCRNDVVMTSFELDLTREFLAKLPIMKSSFDEWGERIRAEIKSLNLDNQMSNVLIRATGKAHIDPCKSAFSDENGNLLEFDQWRDALLNRSPATKQAFARIYPKIGGLYGFGQKGIRKLLVALQESKTA